MCLRPELAGQKIIFAMREDHAVRAVQIIHDLHVEITAFGVVDCVFYTLEFLHGRLDEHELRAQEIWFVFFQPVCPRHGDGTWWEEEELIHRLQNCRVRVQRKNSVILGLVEGQELGVTISPRGCIGLY